MDKEVAVEENLKENFKVLAVRPIHGTEKVDIILNSKSIHQVDVPVGKENIDQKAQNNYSNKGQVNFHLKNNKH